MTAQLIEREAKLFEAGSYPDRGIEVSEEDLDRIIANTSEAPVRIEHSATPFDGALGVLKSVYRKGRELFGRLCFTQAAWELIKAANAKRLSVAILKDKSGIAEVSLVREPRVADAAVFSEGDSVRIGDSELTLEAEFSAPVDDAVGAADQAVVAGLCPGLGEGVAAGLSPGLEATESLHYAEGLEATESLHYAAGEDAEVLRLRRQLLDKEADALIDEAKRSGKLAPAAEIFARAILRSDESSVITFGDRPTPISQVFRWFLDSQPKVIEFSELAPADSDSDEPELFAKLGVTARQVERHRGR